MSFRLFISLFLVFISNIYCDNDLKRAKQHLKDANTYYWFARARGDQLAEIRKCLFHYQQAQKILENLPNKSRQSLLLQTKRAIKEIQAQININKKLLKNYSPLFAFFTKKDNFLVSWKNVQVVAIERSLTKLLKRTKALFNYYIVVVSATKSFTEEEIVRGYLLSLGKPVLNQQQLSECLNEQQIQNLYQKNIPKSILKAISDKFCPNGIRVIRVEKQNKVDNLLYYRTSFGAWSNKQLKGEDVVALEKSSKFAYGNGFVEKVPRDTFFLWLLLFIGFIATWFFNKFNSHSHGRFAPLWLATTIAILTMAVIAAASKGLSALGPNGNELIFSPVGFWWISVISFAVSLLPLLFCYFTASRFSNISALLNNPETIAALFFGSILGTICYLGKLAWIRLGPLATLPVVAVVILNAAIFSWRFGRVYSLKLIKNEEKANIEYQMLLVLITVYCGIIFLWNQTLVFAATIVFFAMLVFAHYISTFAIKYLKSKKENKQKKSDQVEGFPWLQSELTNPSQFFYISWQKEFNEALAFINNSNSGLPVIFVEGGLGCGKTRTAQEIAKAITLELQKSNTQCKVLFGDSEELHEENFVPYQPFAQAMGDMLGMGRFINPADKAENLKASLVEIGLNTALSSVGVGALKSFLDAYACDDESIRKTNEKEIASIIVKSMREMTKKGQVIFILDDTQWMDEASFSLLKLLLLELANESKLAFILTSRKVSEEDKVKKFIFEESKINLFTKIDEKILEDEKLISELLLALHFEYRSCTLLVDYFRERGIVRPLHILQTLETIFDKNWIETVANQFILHKDADLKVLPPPENFEHMVCEQLSGLDPLLIDILHCSAIVGRSFRVSIIAEIFNMDILQILRLLETAEKRGLIQDVVIEDDIYEFAEKRMVGIFRNLKSSRSDELQQMAREYRKRLIDIMEKSDALLYRKTLVLAAQTFALADIYYEKAVYYNRLAAEESYAKGIFVTALSFYGKCLAVIKKYGAKVSATYQLELYISYAKCLLEQDEYLTEIEELISCARTFLESSSEQMQIEMQLIEILYLYRCKQYRLAAQKAQQIIDSSFAFAEQKAKAKLYNAILQPNKASRHKAYVETIAEIKQTIENSENKKTILELQKLKAWACTSLAFILLESNKKKEAQEYFSVALELYQLPQINDIKEIAKVYGALGDCYQDRNKAKESYLKSLDLFCDIGHKQGIVDMSIALGSLEWKLARQKKNQRKKFLGQAQEHYQKSYLIAQELGNYNNLFTIAVGMLEIAIVENENAKLERAIAKLEHLIVDYRNANIQISAATEQQTKAALKKLVKNSVLFTQQAQNLQKMLHQ